MVHYSKLKLIFRKQIRDGDTLIFYDDDTQRIIIKSEEYNKLAEIFLIKIFFDLKK